MHYNEVFLVYANTAKSALNYVCKWMEQFNENDDKCSTPEWDWWVFGGRWCWGGQDLFKKYANYISKPSPSGKESYYRGGPDDKGSITVEFPDGTSQKCEYGMRVESAIKDYVEAHADESEVINATNPKFWEILKAKTNTKNIENDINYNIESMMNYATGAPGEFENDMFEYYNKKNDLLKNKPRWTKDLYFWNITDNRWAYDEAKIKSEPDKWWLANVDCHD